MKADYLIVGAGFAGAVLAERLARVSGKRVLICDKRPHIAGNAYDYHDAVGLLVHKYGPHIFHTNSDVVFNYLSQFTAWRPYEHRVLASVDGQLLPIPINLDTVNRLYDLRLDSAGLEAFFKQVAEKPKALRTSEDRAFATALLHQCRGIALSMRAIREVNPSATLVQTDDLRHVRSTPSLAHQADFENERRWLAFELLLGRVDAQHPMWPFLRVAPEGDRLLGLLRDEPCPPDIVGLNYYVTSERFLDDRLGLDPTRAPGGNGRDRYVDVEAARGCSDGLLGARRLLGQAWERLGIPLALTEAHLACSIEEQLRWLDHIDAAARGAQDYGADVRAWTAWALFGSYDWHTLLTRHEGFYEPGAFDCRTDPPESTVLASYMRARAHQQRFEHPALKERGWWTTRDDRLLANFARKATAPYASLPQTSP